MEIAFASRRLRRCYERSSQAVREWGPIVGTRYIQRIEILYAAREFSELFEFRSLRVHPLKGSRRGRYAITLTGQWRLIVTKGTTESQVRIEEVSNHYGD